MIMPQAQFRIGTSGYQYEHWKGRFYPHELRGTDSGTSKTNLTCRARDIANTAVNSDATVEGFWATDGLQTQSAKVNC